MPIASTDWRLAWPSSRKQVWQRGCSRMFYKGSNCGSLTSEEVKYAKAQDPCLAPRRHATNRGAALPACAAPVRQRNLNISAFLVGVATSISGPDLQLSQ